MRHLSSSRWSVVQRTFRVAAPATLAALAVVLIPAALAGGASDKRFDACLQSGGQPVCTDTATPSVVPGGSAAAPLTLTITNVASTQSLGSIDLRAPAALAIDPASVTTSHGTAAIKTAGQIQLHDMGLGAGSSATVSFTVQTPCAASGLAWSITGRQSNRFLGSKNDFFARALSGFTTDVAAGGCHLAIVRQPSDAQVGRTITSVDYDPGAAPVLVEVHNASNQLVATAAGSVTLTPSAGSFSGTTASLSGGTATFPSLQSSTPGTYTVTAGGSGYASSSPSSSFEIGSKLVFYTQPKDATTGSTITTADFGTVPPADHVKVAVVPPSDTAPWDPISTATGSVALAPSSNAGSFTGTTASFSAGVASFTTLKSSATGTYTLVASSAGSTSSPASDPFAISDFGTTCPAGDTLCQGSAQSGDGKTSASVSSTTPDGFGTNTTLAITMLASSPPAGACDGFTPLPGSQGVFVDVRPLTDMTEITIRLNKALVNAKPNNGAAHFEVCFGGKIVGESPATTPFTTKDGSLASYDAGSDLFWGLLPDCSGTPTEPCVQSRNKDKSGDVIVVFAVPFPWDPIGYSG